MDSDLCLSSGIWAFSDPCVRAIWSAFAPVALVALIGLSHIPLPNRISETWDFITSPLQAYITLAEAEALDNSEGEFTRRSTVTDEHDQPNTDYVPLWRTIVLSWVALLEALAWLSIGVFRLIINSKDLLYTLCPIAIAGTWLYASIRPIVYPTLTPPFDLFALFLCHLATGTLILGGVLYDWAILEELSIDWFTLIGLGANLSAVVVLLFVILQMPLGIPSKRARREDIGKTVSPEDYTSLWSWITFSWIEPILKGGSALKENDVWALSPTIKSQPIFAKFRLTLDTLRNASPPRYIPVGKSYRLIRTLFVTNSQDLLLDFILTLIKVCLKSSGPIFLKGILEAIDHPSHESHVRAYIYAFLACITHILAAEIEIQHRWLCQRAVTRMRSELMAVIFDKSLKRIDCSGIIDKEKEAASKEARRKNMTSTSTSPDNRKSFAPHTPTTIGKPDAKSNDPRGGADVGKVVNLMSTDANELSALLGWAYNAYGAPLQIFIAGALLYNLLGWSALMGGVVLLASFPLNNYFARRKLYIHKGFSIARDERMTVLNEFIGAIKSIKFFAWDDRWIARTLEARDREIQWLIKARNNWIQYDLLWYSVPALVLLVSFLAFVVQGNELTIPIAFTSIALFGLLQRPLNILPMFFVDFMQCKVALDRIATYLDEEEVSHQVSTLKRARVYPGDSLDETGLGIQSGFFRWNESSEEKPENTLAPSGDETATETATSSGDETATETAASSGDDAIPRFELKDINVIFPEGQLTMVTGPTGSGKTALLMGLLGELTALPGSCLIMSKDTNRIDSHGLMHAISYAAQFPWLRYQSIRGNILFGQPFNEARYEQVIECCALKPDLQILEDGDATEIGARGITLSGGQKARVALARAIYAPTKYVLLDDPLSAVDSQTARFLLERLFCGSLLKHRTVILVTHHVELMLPAAYYLIRMLDGRIDMQGTVANLQNQGMLEIIKQDASSLTKEGAVSEQFPKQPPDGVESPTSADRKPRKLVQEEHREMGQVKWSIYKAYLKASSYWTWIALLLLIVAIELVGLSEKLWIKAWGEAYGRAGSLYAAWFLNPKSITPVTREISVDVVVVSTLQLVHPDLRGQMMSTSGWEWPSAQQHPMFYVGIFSAFQMAQVAIETMRTAVQLNGGVRASRTLFKRLLVTVVRATMRWHDTTPQGRMLNRFGKDMEKIDTTLSTSLSAVNASLAFFFASTITVAFFLPEFILPGITLAFIYYRLAVSYLNTGRDLRRMESNTRSPIYSAFGEVLEGIVTVRAFSAEKQFLNDLHRNIDLTTKMWYTFWMTNRWLLLRFDVLGALTILLTTFFALSGFVSTGIAGICITCAMTFTESIYWLCRFWTTMELDLNAVERVVEYLDIPQEPVAIVQSNPLPAYWPSTSNQDYLVQVDSLAVKYAPELPEILHEVSFNLKAKERIGLLGRTGSGKSTLAMSLLRFVEPSKGRIIIDGVDISTIGLHDLRSRLIFIPQDATLFSGSLRENLDPFEEYEDKDCLDVLYRVHLLSRSAFGSQHPSCATSRAPSTQDLEQEDSPSSISTFVTTESNAQLTLDTAVSAGGANFSQGQRQLIALARALLRRGSIIILDEATSSIDFDTDAKIQATIREEFCNSLLITIAHRLQTIIDYDRLMILDNGELVEFDTPFNLIQKEGGIFRSLCLNSGSFAELEAIAKSKAEEFGS